VLHWTNEAKKLWPDATFILFDAFAEAEFLYDGYDYHIGALSDEEKEVNFYQNDFFPCGNSYYREIGSPANYFPKNNSIRKLTTTLDKVVKERGFPLPDFIKIDVQGCEMDILKGGMETVKHATRLIVELQHMEYNEGAMQASESVPIIEEMGFRCVDPMFTNAGPDADYGFLKV
jgi:FkbM family methyltransferase